TGNDKEVRKRPVSSKLCPVLTKPLKYAILTSQEVTQVRVSSPYVHRLARKHVDAAKKRFVLQCHGSPHHRQFDVSARIRISGEAATVNQHGTALHLGSSTKANVVVLIVRV